jgi:S-adenosylhomocysteine hydrolase
VGRAARLCRSTRPIVCVEQTQSGMHAAHPVADPRWAPPGGLAVINVAQSLTKLVLESSLIATSVVDNLESWLHTLLGSAGVDWRKLTVGVIGFGSVGETVAAELKRRDATVAVYDLNRNRSAAAKRQEYEVALTLDALVKDADVIIGATNGSWLDEEHAARLRDGVVLASASSGDIEFHKVPGSWESEQVPILDAAPSNRMFDTIHGEIRLHRPDGATIHILNGGFPVNFNGAIDPIDPAQIQLTRALMVAGVLQIVGFKGLDSENVVGTTGVYELHETLDRFLFESYAEPGRAHSLPETLLV